MAYDIIKMVAGERVILADVGAAGGIHDRWGLFPDDLLTIGFEPDKTAFSRLKQDRRQIWINKALYSDDKEHALYITKSPTNTSLLHPNYRVIDQLANGYPDALDGHSIINTVQLKCDLLDAALKEAGVEEVDAIKLDTQGSELEILKGGEEVVAKQLFAIESEVEFIELYQNQPLFADVDTHLRKRDFLLMDLGNILYVKGRNSVATTGDKGVMVAADVLYFRTVESVCNLLEKGDIRKLTAIFKICLVYGYPGYGIEICMALKQSGLFESDYLEKLLSGLREYQVIRMHRGWPRLSNMCGQSVVAGLVARLARGLSKGVPHVAWRNKLANR